MLGCPGYASVPPKASRVVQLLMGSKEDGQKGVQGIVSWPGHHLQQPRAPGVNPSPPDPADPNTSLVIQMFKGATAGCCRCS